MLKTQPTTVPYKPIECPVCLGTTLEPNLHTGSILCYYCQGQGYIGNSKPLETIKEILGKKK